MVSGAAGADDLFTAPWLGFNAGSSAYPGNPQPFERDPTSLATADFNGDGYVDVAVANYEYSAPGGGTDGMSGFAVLFGGPDRRFSQPTHVTVSNRGCWDIVAADFNNDDHPDVAVSISDALWEGTTVRVYLNDGSGAFPVAHTRSVLDGPIGLAAADFDADGNIDLAVASYRTFEDNGAVSILRGDGTGSLLAATPYLIGRRPWKLEAGDLDGDGDIDLATGNSGADNEGRETMTVLFGTGTGTFTGRTDYYLPFSPDLIGATGLTSGDIDLDGDADIMAVTVANGMAVYENDGTGGFSFRIRYGLSWDPWSIVHADLDGDGIKDIATLTSDVHGMALSAALTILPGTEAAGSLIFQDGFGSGDTSAWSATVP
jgi:hypothetical protein